MNDSIKRITRNGNDIYASREGGGESVADMVVGTSDGLGMI